MIRILVVIILSYQQWKIDHHSSITFYFVFFFFELAQMVYCDFGQISITKINKKYLRYKNKNEQIHKTHAHTHTFRA